MIDLHIDGALWQITINRPEKANSLTTGMLTDLRDTLRRAKAEGAQALILTGIGKVFSAGADLEEAKAGLATSPLWEEVSGAVADFDGLSIAALNGTLAGGANGMALACDLRLATPNAQFFYPVMRLGYLPQPSDPIRMAALIGPARTKMLLVAGAKIDATQALTFGLIDAIHPPEALLPQARALLAEVLGGKQGHGAAIKAMIPR